LCNFQKILAVSQASFAVRSKRRSIGPRVNLCDLAIQPMEQGLETDKKSLKLSKLTISKERLERTPH
jgi:hypothetical protein